MEENRHLDRAGVLIRQGRHDLAEHELRQHLGAEPGDAYATALLAHCLLGQEKRADAEEAARAAVGLEPEMPFAHFVLARVLTDRNRPDEADVAIREALRLDPNDPDHHAVRAAIAMARRRWREALEAAEAGLECDAEHAGCGNVRAMALVKLGRGREADETVRGVLSRDPDDALTHANRGWALLDRGDHRQALGHFRESLRLDPHDDWARAGLVEAIKARNPFYRFMLRYFLWIERFGPRVQWGLIVAGLVGVRVLRTIAAETPALALPISVVISLYAAFILSTWLAAPIANLLVLLHPLGRHALDADQRRQSVAVGGCLLVAILSLVGWMVAGRGDDLPSAALVAGMMALPVAAIFTCQPGWPRWTMIAIAVAVAVPGIASVVLAAVAGPDAIAPAATALSLFLVGFVAALYLARWLGDQRPQPR